MGNKAGIMKRKMKSLRLDWKTPQVKASGLLRVHVFFASKDASSMFLDKETRRTERYQEYMRGTVSSVVCERYQEYMSERRGC